MNDKVYASLVKLCTVNYSPASDEMILTVHRWFANKSCPGNWLYARLGDLAAKVTAEFGGAASGTSGGTVSGSTLYCVRKTWADCKSQLGAYKVLKNAKAKADANPGHSVFDADGNVVYAGMTSSGAALSGCSVSYYVRVSISNLNIRTGSGTDYPRTGRYTGIGTFTITAESDGQGVSKWGKLKSGSGWISLDFVTRIYIVVKLQPQVSVKKSVSAAFFFGNVRFAFSPGLPDRGPYKSPPSERWSEDTKHNLKIRVSKEPQTNGIVSCKSITLREKFMRGLFGEKMKVTDDLNALNKSVAALTQAFANGDEQKLELQHMRSENTS